MENKYYTPALEDLFIGYECEIKNAADAQQRFNNGVVTKDFLPIIIRIKSDSIRTKYLDREDIEKCGWEYDEDSIRQLPLLRFVKYESGRVCNAVWLDDEDHTIDIIQNNFNGGGGYYSIFKGECKSINELRKVMKMIGIK